MVLKSWYLPDPKDFTKNSIQFLNIELILMTNCRGFLLRIKKSLVNYTYKIEVKFRLFQLYLKISNI